MDCKSQWSEETGEAVSPGHDRTTAPMNSEYLWLSAQGLVTQHRDKGSVSPTPDWGTTDSWEHLAEGELVFFKGIGPD